LEMLEAKTKGNLTREEETLLKQSLMTLRLAFVETVESPAPPPSSGVAGPASPSEPAAPPSEDKTSPAAGEEGRKRFSKKY